MLQVPHNERTISRSLFLYDFNQTFSGDPDRGFSILNQVSENFHIPFSEIQVCGLSQVGYSYFSSRDFTPQLSDLDIALVSPRLFQQFSEWTFWTTRRYTDLTGFQIRNGVRGPVRIRTSKHAKPRAALKARGLAAHHSSLCALRNTPL
jgi:hypothetical protein